MADFFSASSKNAIKHGACSGTLILSNESEADWDLLFARWLKTYRLLEQHYKLHPPTPVKEPPVKEPPIPEVFGEDPEPPTRTTHASAPRLTMPRGETRPKIQIIPLWSEPRK